MEGGLRFAHYRDLQAIAGELGLRNNA